MRGRDASEVSRRCTAWGGAETSKHVSRITATAIGQADACAESVVLRNYGLVFAQWGLGHQAPWFRSVWWLTRQPKAAWARDAT